MSLCVTEISFPHYDCYSPYYWQQRKQEQKLAGGKKATPSEMAQAGPATGQGSRPATPSEVAQASPATGQGSRPARPTEAGQLQEDRAAALR